MKRPTGKIITSILGAIFIAGILVLINALAGAVNFRIDLTDNNIYTLSDASKKIIPELNEPVTIRFYFSRSNKQMPLHLKNFATRIEDLLQEYQQAGKGRIHLEKFDPEPFSDAEDSAIIDGVTGQALKTGDKIYLGLAIACGKKTVTIPFISPNAENLLEYKITSAITEVFRTHKPTIGIMSALPVMGGPPSQAMIKRKMFQMSKPWLVINELKKNFNVIKVPINANKIENIDMLLLIHPAGIQDSAQFAIDQFILKGGNVVAFLDPLSVYALSMEKAKITEKGKISSTLDRLFKCWNIEFNTITMVTDAVFGRNGIVKGQELQNLHLLDISRKGICKDDVVTSQLNILTMYVAGSFEGNPPENLKQDVLLKTTADSCKLSVNLAENPQLCFRHFKADKKVYNLAIRLSGKFKTAFPDGNPSVKARKDKTAPASLKEAQNEAAVILVADSDMLFDMICFNFQELYNQQIATPKNSNLSFFQNTADAMCGDKRLIGIRCRPVIQRPFDHVKKIQADAKKEYKEKVLELEKKLLATEKKLNVMQKLRTDTNRTKFLSSAQQTEMKKFREQQIVIRKQIKQIQKQYRQKVDALENELKWLNIAMMPLLIFLFGIGVAVYRKTRNSAK